jgi:hypothetical protein
MPSFVMTNALSFRMAKERGAKRACPRSVCDSRTANCCSRRITFLSCSGRAMASRPKSSGGYKRSERARYMCVCAPPRPPSLQTPARGLALERHARLGRRSPILIFCSLFCDRGTQSRTKDFYRSPGRCEHALKKPWRGPKPFQDAYPADNAQPSRSSPRLVSRAHHSAIRRRSSERFGEFIEFLG